MTADVEAFSKRLISASNATSFLDNDGPVSTNSFVGTNDGRLVWAMKATGVLGTEGVAGLRGIEGDT